MVSGIAHASNLLLAHRFTHPLQKNHGGFRAFVTRHELAQFRIIEFNLTYSTNLLIPWGFLNVVWWQKNTTNDTCGWWIARHFGFIAESDPVDKQSCQFGFSCIPKPVFAGIGGCVDICRPSAATGSIPPDIHLLLNGMVAMLSSTPLADRYSAWPTR